MDVYDGNQPKKKEEAVQVSLLCIYHTSFDKLIKDTADDSLSHAECNLIRLQMSILGRTWSERGKIVSGWFDCDARLPR